MNEFDFAALKRAFNRTAERYDAVQFPKIIAKELLARLEMIKIQPKTILDLGAGTGFLSTALQQRFSDSRIIALDLAESRLQRIGPSINKVAADMHHLPFKTHSVELIVSNLAVYWSTQPAQLFAEIARVLKPEGVLLFSSFGPDTLQELRLAFSQVDDTPHVNLFLDLHDIGDILQQAGFKDPVMDVDWYPVRFKALAQLFEFLKNQGEGNFLTARCKSLFGRKKWAHMQTHYPHHHATFEVIFGHGIGQKVQHREGNVVMIPLAEIKKAKLS